MAVDPNNIQELRTQALTLLKQGRLEEGRELFMKVVHAQPQDAEAWYILSAVNGNLGRFSDTAECCRRAIALRPEFSNAHANLANALISQGDYAEAEQAIRRWLGLQPQLAPAQHALGKVYQLTGRWQEAESSFRTAIRMQPDFVQAYVDLGIVLQFQGRLGEAEQAYVKALEMQPQLAGCLCNLGVIKHDRGEFTEAEACYRRAVELEPRYIEPVNNLGTLLREQGRVEEALEQYRKALDLDPRFMEARSNLCFALNYLPGMDVQTVYEEHRKWDEVYGGHAAGEVFGNRREADRRLKVGYVSSDFRYHSVAFFVEALLAAHDREQVEAVCYANVEREDGMTERLRGLADEWVSIGGWSDEAVKERIRADGVDILVDLNGHTKGHRLKVFAARAAPVQVTYLGYPNTTGLEEMDYRLTDGWADPEQMQPERYYSERLVRLAGGFLGYTPHRDAPEVGPLPAVSAGHVTLGSFNNLGKMNDGVVAVWSEILARLENGRLILKNKALGDEGVRERCWSRFEQRGIARERVELVGYIDGPEGHHGLYNRVDIGLDPFPYNGTTTTCEALWMGVPVVVLAGDRHAGRVGVSLLEQVGLGDWIAGDEETYIARAVSAARDIDVLAQLRSGLRERMAASPLCDGARLAREVEQAYRRMWRDWCSAQ